MQELSTPMPGRGGDFPQKCSPPNSHDLKSWIWPQALKFCALLQFIFVGFQISLTDLLASVSMGDEEMMWNFFSPKQPAKSPFSRCVHVMDSCMHRFYYP